MEVCKPHRFEGVVWALLISYVAMNEWLARTAGSCGGPPMISDVGGREAVSAERNLPLLRE